MVFSIRVGRSIQGFGLSPGITKEQRVGVENLFKGACQKFSGEAVQCTKPGHATYDKPFYHLNSLMASFRFFPPFL